MAHDFEKDGIYYNIMSSTDMVVSVTYRGSNVSEYSNEYTGDVIIPDYVFYDEKQYKVIDIGVAAFQGCRELTSVTIPNSVVAIEFYAFSNCRGLTSVTIPDSVTYIWDHAFEGCKGLTSVIIGNSVIRIGNYAFDGCIGLTYVTIGNNVTSIGSSAFFASSEIKSITCKATMPPSIPNGVFYHVNKFLCTLKVPASSVDAYYNADGWREFAIIEAIKEQVSPVVVDGSEITEQNAEDITEFKMNLDEGVTFAVNDGAKVELWIGGVLKGAAEKKDISEKDGIVTLKFTPVSTNANARGMLGEFWNTVATSSTEDVEIQVKIAANSFKINNEDITEELSYSYTAEASVAEKIDQVLAIDEIDAGGTKNIIYNLNGSRINGNTPNGIIIKNGNKVLVK